MKTYATRAEAIRAEIITPLEASGEKNVRITWDIEAVADEVLSGLEDGYALKVDVDDFWDIVENNERTVLWTKIPWFHKDVWTGWTTYDENTLYAYVLVVKEEVSEDEAYEDGDWNFGVEEVVHVGETESGRKKFELTGNWREFDTLSSAEEYIVSKITR